MARLILTKLKGSTLLETLVALSIMLLVFSIATIVFVQVTGSSKSAQKIRASELAKKIFGDTKETGSYFDEEIEMGEFRIRKEVLIYSMNEAVLEIRLYTYNDNRKLLDEFRALVPAP